MGALVSCQVATEVSKSFPAVIALIGLVPAVDALVRCQVATLGKSFPAVFTLIGLVPAVDALVRFKIGGNIPYKYRTPLNVQHHVIPDVSCIALSG